MILLQGHSLAKVRKIPLESLSLQITERTGTATMIPADMTGIEVGSWILDDTDPGKGIVYRVTSISTAYHTDTPTVQMEHIINTLRDKILFGEYSADTATDAIKLILEKQNFWTLGNCEYSVSNPYKFDGDTLYDALDTVCESLSDSYWDYDMSAYPFKLYIRKRSSTVGTRMRAGRNLRTISRKVDRSGMYTRFYPIGKDDLRLSTEYVQKNTDLYGVVEHVETDTTIDSESELKRWANQRLKRHAEPVVTVDVEGFELADATGESLDRMTLGAICEIPLPEYNTTISERIVSLNYPDKVHSPELVKIQLSNTRADLRRITDIVADAIKNGTSGRGGRAGAKQAKEDHAWFEDTNEHVAMCAIGIIGVDAQGEPNWTRLSEVIADGEGIHQTVTEIQGENVIRDSKIEQNEKAISAEVTDRSVADEELKGMIRVSASEIRAEVSSKTSKAALILAITGGKSSAVITADLIELDGDAVANSLYGETIYCDTIHFETADVTKILADSIVVDGYNISNPIMSGTVSGNTLTLYHADGSEAVTFNKAVTLEGAWSSGSRKFTVKAYQTNNGVKTKVKETSTTLYSSIPSQQITWDGYWGKAKLYADYNGGKILAASNITINGKGAYDNGYSDGADSVSHSISASATTGWTGSIAGRTSLGSATASSLARTYILIDVSCGGTSQGYYLTMN